MRTKSSCSHPVSLPYSIEKFILLPRLQSDDDQISMCVSQDSHCQFLLNRHAWLGDGSQNLSPPNSQPLIHQQSPVSIWHVLLPSSWCRRSRDLHRFEIHSEHKGKRLEMIRGTHSPGYHLNCAELLFNVYNCASPINLVVNLTLGKNNDMSNIKTNNCDSNLRHALHIPICDSKIRQLLLKNTLIVLLL